MAIIDRSSSYATFVAQILRDAPEPMSVDELLVEIGKRRPVGANGRSTVNRALRTLFQAVPIETGCYGWFSHLLKGAFLRHPLTDEEARRGFILLDELEHALFFPEFFQDHDPIHRTITVRLLDGPVLQAEASVEQGTWSLRLGREFVRWIERVGGSGRDQVIVHVCDAEAGRYDMRLQPREGRDEEQIADRNLALALAAEAIVAADRRDRDHVPAWELAAGLVALGLFDDPAPPDDLHYVLHQYSVLHYVQGVGYALRDGASGERARLPRRKHAEPQSRLDVAPSHSRVEQTGEQPSDESLHDWLDSFSFAKEGVHMADFNADETNGDEEDSEFCNAFLRYLERVAGAESKVLPLSHHEFHLIAAELEYMLALEEEFTELLVDQVERLRSLAERLLLDPETLSNEDLDIPDYPDFDEPPFWEN